MKKLLIMIVACITVLTACNRKDGDWPPIKLSHSTLTVPLEGGTVQTMVINYSELWLIGLTRDSKRVVERVDDWRILESPYLTAKSEGQLVIITVAPSNDGKNHTYVIDVENGDAFSEITIEQKN